MARVVIIGAGITGLATAHYLECEGCADYVIFEKEKEVGGLCRSVRVDGFTFDFTGHLLHSCHNDHSSFLGGIDAFENWKVHARRAYVYSEGIYTPYPYQSNLYGLPASTVTECIVGFVNRRKSTGVRTNFTTWARSTFGSGFAKHFFIPYQRKLFDFPAHRVRTGWLSLVPKTSLQDILEGALLPRMYQSVGYNAHFLYPREGGIDRLPRALAQTRATRIRTGVSVTDIDVAHKKVVLEDGSTEAYEFLVSTMPLSTLLTFMARRSKAYGRAAQSLVCNAVININFGVARPSLIDKHWVYYPEKHYPFFRIGFPHELGNTMVKAGCSSLSVEVATLKKICPSFVEHCADAARSHVMALFNLRACDIVTEKVLILDHAYVIYDMWREKNIAALLRDIEQKSIHSVGRYGAWKYSSMHDAITDGFQTAHTIINILKKRKGTCHA